LAQASLITKDFGQFAEFPDDTCFEIMPGPDEEKRVYARPAALAYRPTLRERLSKTRWSGRAANAKSAVAPHGI